MFTYIARAEILGRKPVFRCVTALAALTICLSFVAGGCAKAKDKTKARRSKELLMTVTIPPRESKLVTVKDLEMDGGIVNQIVFDSDTQIFINEPRNQLDFYYYFWRYYSEDDVWRVVGPYADFYKSLWDWNFNTLSFMLPVRNVSRADFPSGDYTFDVFNGSNWNDATVDVYKVKKDDADFSSGALDINLIVYNAGEPNPVIPDNAGAITIKKYMNEVLFKEEITQQQSEVINTHPSVL